MNVFDAYIVGCVVGLLFGGIAFLVWYWLQPKAESPVSAFSRGFDAGWDAGWNSCSRTNNIDPDLMKSLDVQWDWLDSPEADAIDEFSNS